MPRINLLDQKLSNMIAAGEVVERPASALKELVENALDAGAKHITAEIRQGGMTYLRVTDDGCGMDREDCERAFLRHATSKIAKPEDLFSIGTLGFRGEALASIAAVSHMELFTSCGDAGTTVTAEGGKITDISEAGCPKGTTFVVRNLFFNTPARMKFLKTDATEAGYITDVMQKMILQNPDVSFKLIANGKQTLFSSGDGNLLSAVRTVWGKDYARDMIPAEYRDELISVTGLTGNFTLARRDRRQQIFYVNGRCIVSKLLSAALSEAYTNSMMVGRYPVAVLHLHLNPALVDVNVHPTKAEVRFSEEKQVYQAVYWAVKNALSDKKHIPEMQTPPPKATSNQEKPASSPSSREKPPSQPKDIPSEQEQKPVLEEPVNFLKDAFIHSVVNESGNKTDKPHKPQAEIKSAWEGFGEDICLSSPVQGYQTDAAPPPPPKVQAGEQLAVSAEQLRAGVDFQVIGQAFATYILVQMADTLLLIDQHAAHERLYFEELKEDFAKKSISSQLLMLPVTLKLNPVEYRTAAAHFDLFASLGFEMEGFGETDIIIRSTPATLSETQIKDAVSDMIHALEAQKNSLTPELFESALHTIACKKALKGNHVLTVQEMERLSERILSLPDINTCPHGRPITIQLTKTYLEKQFKRIVS